MAPPDRLGSQLVLTLVATFDSVISFLAIYSSAGCRGQSAHKESLMNSLLQPRIFSGLSEVQVTIRICVALVLCFPLAAQTSGAKDPSPSATSVRAQLIGSWRL